MQSISVLLFRSPVFGELQGPIQDRYGIHQGWIQHLRVCILQPRAPANFVTKADRCLHPRNNAARVGTRRLSSRSFDCAPTAGRGRQDFACGLRRPQRKKRPGSSHSRCRAHLGLKSKADTGASTLRHLPASVRMTAVAFEIRLARVQLFLSCQRTKVQAVYPWGLGWSRRARVKSRVTPSLIPESHRDGWESMSCCRIDVGSTAKRQHFDSKVLSL